MDPGSLHENRTRKRRCGAQWFLAVASSLGIPIFMERNYGTGMYWQTEATYGKLVPVEARQWQARGLRTRTPGTEVQKLVDRPAVVPSRIHAQPG